MGAKELIMRNAIVLALVMVLTAAALAENSGNPNPTPGILTNVLFQDFENPSSWNGSNPPTGWTVADSGQGDGIWNIYDWYKYSAWGGGTARVSGGTQDLYNDDWLISPAVDFNTAAACTLFFRHYYDDYLSQAADSALVLLSNDNGASWGDTVRVYAGADYGSDTVPDSEYFNISSFASGHSQVKVAFQYVKRQAVVTGSWRIDDVKLRADGSSLLSQNFDSSWGPNGDNPPANWAILDVHVAKWDDNDWHQANLTDWGNAAAVTWSPIEQQSEYLISPAMDFSDGAKKIKLSLKQWYYHELYNQTDKGYILGSIDGGTSWPETLAFYNHASHGSQTSPAYDTINIASWANYQANVKIGFKFVGTNNGKWYVDSVAVERIDSFDDDVKVDSILAPTDITIEGYWWPVTAVVQNAGVNTHSFNVVCQIYDSTGAMVYANTQLVSALNSLERRHVNFDLWQAGEPNVHTIKCFTILSGDQDNSNDTLITTTQTYHHVGQGGPIEGWSYKDNITGGGPYFSWVDIKSQGTPISFSDPDNGNSGMIDMGMNFYYFGQTFSRISVSTDGWLSFLDSTGVDNTQSEIPDADGPAAMIALLWTDLHLRTGNIYYYHDVPTNRFIVQYDSVEYASIPGSDIGMEIIFNGNNNGITMQYSYFRVGSETGVTVGLENQTQDLGLPYDNNGEIGQTPLQGLAITFTYLPPHDVSAISIEQPTMIIHGGSTYDIVAKILNSGANTENFEVTATDNYGYSNTQSITNLLSLDSAIVTFPNWEISNSCSSYTLTVYCNLGEDLDRSNDTTRVSLMASKPSNLSFIHDDGVIYGGIYTYDTTDVVANKIVNDYENANVSAVFYKFVNEDEFPNRPVPDSFIASIFIDNDDNGIPDDTPILTRHVATSKTGWTLWNIGCDTILYIDCKDIWVSWSIIDSARFCTIGQDRTADYPLTKWVREHGLWHPYSNSYGDFMIRAFVQADTSTGPRIALGNSILVGGAQPQGVDTVSTYLENSGIGCNLDYQVNIDQVVQGSLAKQDLNLPITPDPNRQIEIVNIHDSQAGHQPPGPPRITGLGGPDNFGYTWIDSDSPGGPIFDWIDISATGTEVTWDHGNNDNGYTEPIPLGMTFNYYGANFDSVVISTNGWITFTRPPDDVYAFNLNDIIPFPGELRNFLAVEWDDLMGGAGGHCYYYHDQGANSFIISWVNWSHNPGGIDPHSFQIIIDGTRGSILYQYAGNFTQTELTVGIENADGTDGLQVTYNHAYLHNGLALLFQLPIFWLTTDLAAGSLPAGDQIPFDIVMNARNLPSGTYNGSINIHSNDVTQPSAVINVQFQIEGVCSYVPGDVNSSGAATGLDVVFMVSYLKGGPPPHEECAQCQALGPGMIYPQGDVNGSCSFTGLDVSYFVSFLKGVWPSLHYCEHCPPGGRVLNIRTEDSSSK